MPVTHYDAFISYSHTADGRLAPAVQNGLQRLARSWRSVRALKVFRDETGLSVNPHLWTSIQEALEHSRYFVLMASPEAARSEWVNREVESWLTEMPGDRILPVLTEGELVWDEAANDFDHDASTAIPPALFGKLTEEPRYLDLRWARADTQLTIRNARFRDAIADLAAPMHGISKDELQSEDVRQYRHRVHLARAAVAAVVLLAVASVVAAIVALGARSHANDLTRAADVGRLAAESVSVRTSQPALARLLAVEAFRQADTVATRGALQQAVFGVLPTERTLVPAGSAASPSGYSTTAISTDGRVAAGIVTSGKVAELEVRDTRTGHLRTSITVPQSTFSVALDADGTRVAFPLESSVRVVDTSDGKVVMDQPVTGTAVALDADGTRVAVGGDTGATVLDVVSGAPAGPLITAAANSSSVALSPDGRSLAYARGAPVVGLPSEAPSRALTGAASTPSSFVSSGEGGVAGLSDVATGSASPRLGPLVVAATSVLFSPTGGQLALTTQSSGVVVVDSASQQSRTVPGARAGFAADGTLVTEWADGTVTRFDPATGRARGLPAAITAPQSEFSGGGSVGWRAPAHLVTGAGAITVWNAAGTSALGQPALGLPGAQVFALNAGGRRIAIQVEPQAAADTVTPDAYKTTVFDTTTGGRIGPDVPGTVDTKALLAGGTRVLGFAASTAGYALYRFPGLEPVASLGIHQSAASGVFPLPGAVAESHDGRRFAFVVGEFGATSSASTSFVQLADSRTGRLVGGPLKLAGAEGFAISSGSISFSPDGRRLLVVAAGTPPTLVDVVHHRVVANAVLARQPANAAAFSPDGRLVALGSDAGVVFVDARTFEQVGIAWQEPGVTASSLTFSPDSARLAVGAPDGNLTAVRVVDVASRATIGGPYPAGLASAPAFVDQKSDRGATLLAGGPGGVMRWSQDPQRWIRSACAAAGQNLSRSDWNRYLPSGSGYRRTCPQYPPAP